LQQYLPQAEMAGFIDHLIRWRYTFADTSSERDGVALPT
jgi:hypothetical protein